MSKQLLLGDEAIAQAALDAGLSGVYAYPGTPSTEITEYIQMAPITTEQNIHNRWCANEKTAMEAALGMSFVGKRALVCMKHVGMNVAADCFVNSAITGVKGGLIVIAADDPSMHSSQNEQDSRFYGDFSLIPMYEPSNQQEAYDMVYNGFEFSEKTGEPILMRMVTRLAHSRSGVERKEQKPQNSISFSEDPRQFILLPGNARKTQIDMGCDADKCLVIPNGIQFDRFKDIPLKPDDGWVDIGAVVRLAPIKDVKTMIYAFFELHERLPKVRLHIMGGVDDEEYGAECHALVDTLGVRDLIFTGRVNVVEYMEKLDFTILTSISEGQPLSVLESLAARRPCVTTEVGCCRELLEGAPGDDFGVAGFVTPPMYRKGLADAMERMCTSRARRIEMGERGQRRVATYFLHEQMLANYRALYDETARAFDLPREGE